jgi:hypothetical protein
VLGAWPWALNNEWPGQLDDFRVFNKLLNSTQISNLYNASNGYGLANLDGPGTDLNFNYNVSLRSTASTLDLVCTA